MATWIAHFRIADYFLDRIPGLNPADFVVGNIGADCGEPNEDWTVFTPPTSVTHWRTGNDPNGVESEGFYDTYLADRQKHPFFLGYYIHLLTDIEWGRQIHHPKKEIYKQQFEEDSRFIWTMKKDWYDQDHLFLRDNPSFRTFQIFSGVKEFPNPGLPYYSDTAIISKVQYITGFYQKEHQNLDREYPYLNKQEMDGFVEKACCNIEDILKGKGLSAC